jgi:hypothetical protein
MRVIRRLYFYLVALISFEVIVWGAITLARTIISRFPGSGTANLLAGGLSMILVGLPIFLLHWNVAQRDARSDEEEHASRLRALYLYGIRAGLLIPVAQNAVAIISRLLFSLFGEPARLALVGSGQTLADNLVAIAFNLVAWVYIERILRRDWDAGLPGNALSDVRRLYRYVWVLYGLLMAITGIDQLIHYLLYIPRGLTNFGAEWLPNGIALTLVGVPIWAYSWVIIQRTLERPEERQSMLRLVVLYLFSLVPAITVLAAVGTVLNSGLSWILGANQNPASFLADNSNSLAIAIPVGVVWAYYSRLLMSEIAALADPLRKASLQRLYFYVLALLGNVATFIGLWNLFDALVEPLLGHITQADVLRPLLARSLALLLVGLPVWLLTWPVMQTEARQANDAGDHARRSLVRKGYLYLVLFAAVVGGMASAGNLFYLVLTTVLGKAEPGFWLNFTRRLQELVLILIWLGYHLSVLRQDGRLAQKALSERHAAFPALVIQDGGGPFAEELVEELHRQSPSLPVVVHQLEESPLSDALLTAKVVVMPAGLALHPPEALRLWLNEYSGQRILVPTAVEGWVYLGASARQGRALAKETAQAVRSLAEGQAVKSSGPTSAWAVVGYVLGVIFALQILFLIITLIISSFAQ